MGQGEVSAGSSVEPRGFARLKQTEGRGRGEGKLTKRKARTVGILFSSTSNRRAFSWLLQYSSYTQNLSFCKTRTEPEFGHGSQAGRQTL